MNPLINIADTRTKVKQVFEGGCIDYSCYNMSRYDLRVSTVLNRNVREFGKSNMFDGNDETCWNSDQGNQQYVCVDAGRPTTLKEIHIRFQGGFSGSLCILLAGNTELDVREIQRFYPSDTSSLQIFTITGDKEYQTYKIVFERTADPFGRITIYHLQMYGD